MPSIRPTSAMYHNCHQIIQTIWIHSIITLNSNKKKRYYYNDNIDYKRKFERRERIFRDHSAETQRLTVLKSLSSNGKTTLWDTLMWRLYCSTYLNLFKCNAKIIGSFLTLIRFYNLKSVIIHRNINLCDSCCNLRCINNKKVLQDYYLSLLVTAAVITLEFVVATQGLCIGKASEAVCDWSVLIYINL